MDYETFKEKIKAMGGTDEDVIRLEEEGYESAMAAHEGLEWLFLDIKDFREYERWIGRQFVIDNLGDVFHLSNEKIEEQE